MTREAFIRKWLGNRNYEYNNQCRDLMRDDLDKVISSAEIIQDEVNINDCKWIKGCNLCNIGRIKKEKCIDYIRNE